MTYLPYSSPKKNPFLIAAFLIPSLLLVAAIWFPFGFSLTALIEEWGILGLYKVEGLFFITDPTNHMPPHALRPLTVLPHSIAHFLDQNSFYYWHVLLILSLIIKGVCTSHLLWKATNSLYWALILGVLVILYPADTMQLSFRGFHINWAFSLSLLASSLFILSLEQKKQIIAYILGVIASFLFFSAICMYEAALSCLFIPFLILYIKNGIRDTISLLKSKKWLALIWFTSAFMYILYVLMVAPKIQSIQTGLMGNIPIKDILAQTVPKLFSIAMLRGFIGGWFDAFRILLSEFGTYGYLYLLFISISLYMLMGFISKKNNFLQSSNNPSLTCSIRLCFIGLLAFILAYIPYVCSLYYIYTTQRTYLFAAFGAILFWGGILILMSHWSKKMASILCVFLVFLGLGAQLFQFHHYIQISTKQKYLLKNIVGQYDGNLGDKTLVIQDETNQLNQTWMFIIGNLRNALIYFYDHPIAPIQVCGIPNNTWQLMDTIGRNGTCIETKDSWVFKYPNLKNVSGLPQKPVSDLIIPKDKVVVVTIKADGPSASSTLNAYQKNLLQQNNNTALRFRNILISSSWPTYFNKFWAHSEKNTYHLNLGRWWGLETPIQGQGWYGPDWQVGKFYHQGTALKLQKKAFVQFKLKPASSSYLLAGTLTNILSESIRKSIKISINKHRVRYHWLDDNQFKADIPPNILLSGTNTIEFTSLGSPKWFGLSFRLASITLSPAQLPNDKEG